MLEVVEVVEPRAAVVKSDGYVPLSVDWMPTGAAGEPLYLNVQNADNDASSGFIIVRLEPLTGEIISVVVVTAPSQGVGEPPARFAALPTVEGGIRADRSRWDLNPDLVPQRGTVEVTAPLALFEDEHYVYYAFSGATPIKKVMAGPAGFAVAEDDTITGIVAERASLR